MLEGGVGALSMGDVMDRTDKQLQQALEAIRSHAAQVPDSELIAAKCCGLMRGYHARWMHQQWKVLDVEHTYTADLANVDTSRKSRSFQIAGKLDATVEINGGVWVVDHKTTSEDIADPNAPYWRQLAIEGQVTHYMLLQWMHGIKPEGALWDVIKKPGISPKKLTKAERASIVANGTYCGFRVSDESRQAMQVEERETFELYEYRLAYDCETTRPEAYFQRRQVPRLDSEILEYARELWQHSQDMLYTRSEISEGRLPPRNSGACLLYGRPCNFLGICSGYDTPDSPKWRHKEHKHPELGNVGNGLELLTNSRIRCYQTCRRKEYYTYQLGLERVDDDNEALWFGSLMHIGLEQWLLYKRNEVVSAS